MKNNYVMKHDFGYGKDLKSLNKLTLRNYQDLEDYLSLILISTYTVRVENNIIHFPKISKVKVDIEKVQ